MAKSIEPKALGLAGALQIARVDRRIGAQAELTHTWLVSSRDAHALSEREWLRREQGRWGPENGTHYPLDVSCGEDRSRVRHSNAAAVLAIFRRLALALKARWAKGRPKRQATVLDWVQHHQANPRHGLALLTRRL